MNPADEQPKPTAPILGEWTPVRATAPDKPAREPLTLIQKILISVVIAGALAVAVIGFTGSYAAVSHLARVKGFGWFANIFPLGVDAGIVALLALDMVLTGFRMRYAPLRPTAWVLTVATIAFNASAAWGDPVAVGMHAVIPFLFVIVVEAARHAIGIIANIEADRHMESPRLTRWLLAFPSTFRIWRRQRLWELRSYEDVIAIERDAAAYRVKLRGKYGRGWRRKAAVAELMPLRLAKYGTPIADTLARQNVEPAVIEERQIDRQNVATEAPIPAPETRPEDRQNDRQEGRQQATEAAPTTATASDTPAAKTAASSRQNKTASGAAKTATISGNGDGATARKPRRRPAKKPRRSMDEWVDLAGPIYHSEFARLRRQPTANEFATAIEKAGLGRVGDSTAKNIRAEILDRTELPALD